MKDLRSDLILILLCLGFALKSQAALETSTMIQQFLSSRKLQIVKCTPLEGQTSCSAMATVRALGSSDSLRRVQKQYRQRRTLSSIYHNVNMQVWESPHAQVIAVSHFLADGLTHSLANHDSIEQALSTFPNAENSLLLSVIQRLQSAVDAGERARIIQELLEDIRLALDQFSPEDIAFLVALATGQPVLLVDASQHNQIVVAELHTGQEQLLVSPVTYDIDGNTPQSLADLMQTHYLNAQVHFLVTPDNQLVSVMPLVSQNDQQFFWQQQKPVIWTDLTTGATRQLAGTDGGDLTPPHKPRSRHDIRLNKHKVRKNIRKKWHNWESRPVASKAEAGYSKIKLALGAIVPLAGITYLALSENTRKALWQPLCGQQTEYGQCLYDIAEEVSNRVRALGNTGYQNLCGEMDVLACKEYYSKKIMPE